MKTAIVWFRNDLRLHDNEALFEALSWADEILPIYIFDPRQFRPVFDGFPKSAHHRLRFLKESVLDLRMNLRDLGADLIIRTGNPEDILFALARHHETFAVFCHEEACDEERLVEDRLVANMESIEGEVNFFWGHTLIHYQDLPFAIEYIPKQFTVFRKSVEKQLEIRPIFPRPKAIKNIDGVDAGELPSDQQLLKKISSSGDFIQQFRGGETNALLRLKEYFWESKNVSTYKETRNGLLGTDYSSRFSMWLANGSLSPRLIWEELCKYEEEIEKNDSTYWLFFELLWRDYFRFVAIQYGNSIFQLGGIQKREYLSEENQGLFKLWREGKTGVPFIDAAMRELLYTGFQSNRARQNTASFLVKDLKLDWRLGAAWFESQLIDYDPASNYLNWNYIAGIGNDPREGRYFNVLTQAKRYDPLGDFVKYWLPELQTIPSTRIHTPFLLNHVEQNFLKIKIGEDYPNLCINQNKWRAIKNHQ